MSPLFFRIVVGHLRPNRRSRALATRKDDISQQLPAYSAHLVPALVPNRPSSQHRRWEYVLEADSEEETMLWVTTLSWLSGLSDKKPEIPNGRRVSSGFTLLSDRRTMPLATDSVQREEQIPFSQSSNLSPAIGMIADEQTLLSTAHNVLQKPLVQCSNPMSATAIAPCASLQCTTSAARISSLSALNEHGACPRSCVFQPRGSAGSGSEVTTTCAMPERPRSQYASFDRRRVFQPTLISCARLPKPQALPAPQAAATTASPHVRLDGVAPPPPSPAQPNDGQHQPPIRQISRPIPTLESHATRYEGREIDEMQLQHVSVGTEQACQQCRNAEAFLSVTLRPTPRREAVEPAENPAAVARAALRPVRASPPPRAVGVAQEGLASKTPRSRVLLDNDAPAQDVVGSIASCPLVQPKLPSAPQWRHLGSEERHGRPGEREPELSGLVTIEPTSLPMQTPQQPHPTDAPRLSSTFGQQQQQQFTLPEHSGPMPLISQASPQGSRSVDPPQWQPREGHGRNLADQTSQHIVHKRRDGEKRGMHPRRNRPSQTSNADSSTRKRGAFWFSRRPSRCSSASDSRSHDGRASDASN